MISINEWFEEARKELGSLHQFGDKDFVCYVIKDSKDDGYRLASTLSPKVQAVRSLSGGLNLYGSQLIGNDSIWLFNDKEHQYPETCLFVYPEHSLVPWQQQQFVNRLAKREEVKNGIIITSSPMLVSDFYRCQVGIIDKNSFQEPEPDQSNRLFVL